MNKCEECGHINVCRKMTKWTPKSKECSDYCEMPKKGEWIEGKNGTIKCNQCGCEIRYSYIVGNLPDYPKFCCDCGAKMENRKKEADND